jgi:Domain of unknown function (DUF6285)
VHDRPTAAELVAAVRGFLEAELLPALADARLRFQALVAANVLGVAERELALEEQHLAEEWPRRPARTRPGTAGSAARGGEGGQRETVSGDPSRRL